MLFTCITQFKIVFPILSTTTKTVTNDSNSNNKRLLKHLNLSTRDSALVIYGHQIIHVLVTLYRKLKF